MKTHFETRISQRAITEWAITQIEKFGDCIHRQGKVFRYMNRRDVERYYGLDERDELLNVIVLTAEDGKRITAYRNPAAVGNIKRKPKRLCVPPKYHRTNKEVEMKHIWMKKFLRAA